MNNDHLEFEDLTPDQARYKLAETKLKLLNALAHLEMLEKRFDHKRQAQHASEYGLAQNGKAQHSKARESKAHGSKKEPAK